MSVTVLELTDPRWQDFVARQPSATPFHHPSWGALIADCYGFRAFAVAASDAAGEIQAGLPVIEVRHLRGEPKWVALPYTDYCPPLAPAPRGETDLVCALRQASKAAGVQRVEVRAPIEGASSVSHGALRHVIPLERDPARGLRRFPFLSAEAYRTGGTRRGHDPPGGKPRRPGEHLLPASSADPAPVWGTDSAAPLLPHAVGIRDPHRTGVSLDRGSIRQPRRRRGVLVVERDDDLQVQRFR